MSNPLPCDVRAEAVVLAELTSNRWQFYDISAKIKPDMFYQQLHRDIFEAIQAVAVADGDFDLTSVLHQLTDSGAELFDVIDVFTNQVHEFGINVENAIKSIRSCYEQREVIKASLLMQQVITVGQPAGAALSLAQSVIDAAATHLDSGTVGIVDQVNDYNEKLARARAGEALNDCVPTGLTQLDGIIDGLFYGQNHVLAGATGMGKSATAMSIVDKMIQAGYGVYVLSCEMGSSQLINRLVAGRLNVNSRDIRKGRLSAAIMDNAALQANLISRSGLHIDDRSGVTPSMLTASVNAHIGRGNRVDVVVIDHLSHIKPDERVSGKYERTSSTMRDLTTMAKNSMRANPFAVLTLHQVSRSGKGRNDKRPQLTDLRDSGTVEEDAYMVVLLYRDAYYNPETSDTPNQIELIVAKNREGGTGTARCGWRAGSASVYNVEFRSIKL